ncbi:MAG: hypothetical protein WAR57_11765 [Candidatus Phosphoribacter sp.]
MHHRTSVLLAVAVAFTAACSGTPTPPSDAGQANATTNHPTGTAATMTGGDAPGPTTAAASSPSIAAGDPTAAVSTAAELQLPRGGTTIFPAHRLVGYSGYPGSPALGRLGVGDLDERVTEIEKLGAEYAAGRTVLPVLELIATVVHSRPGADGLYRTRIDDDVVARHLEAARRHRAILLLNIQPGRARFLDEVEHWARWLREPDVGLALDPEWAVGPGQVPGKVFGRSSGAELDEIAEFLSGIVATHRLPEKVLLYHQLHASIVREPAALQPHPGVALVVSVDGIGNRAEKTSTWTRIVSLTPAHVHKGFKLFYDEDTRRGPLMTPAQVLQLSPQPEYVLYE